ncbi:low molecular weight phosphotyrosine protein phosphatase 1-like [Sitodiplosis mosellana]|uniref:low molecular weight phosphotyrosine protein phosphatase 1-like n=1 Tax=Sitodiplosis mosellana TaxID=263140 RepID=UPI002444C3C0|nr:low molecular weight phosphotyrosine protein phosphatase 1-like [Sitodiplosis mosellana]
MGNKKRILFVCLGNTCRSPIVEAVFMDLVKRAGVQRDWEIDSAAIEAWHVGNRPNPRAVAVMEKYCLAYDNRARHITTDDFYKFDYILAMDEYNVEDLTELRPDDAKAQIFLLGDFDPEGERIIRDPYCDTNSDGFDKCYHQAVRSCKSFLEDMNTN